MEYKNNTKDKSTKEDGVMAKVTKPCTGAFMLRADKVDQFVKKDSVSKSVMDRFFAHKPKKGVKTPFK